MKHMVKCVYDVGAWELLESAGVFCWRCQVY